MTRRDLITALAGAPALLQAQAPAFTLPKLPYAFDALEPHVDAQTMQIHHGKHHQAYVDNLNKAISAEPSLRGKSLESLLSGLQQVPESVRTAVRNNGGGHANHDLFWKVLGSPKGGPAAGLAQAINKSFGSREQLEDKLRATGLTVFGSGWVWVVPEAGGGLRIETSPNQDSPWMAGRKPLLGLDVWEHAYYLKYQNRRADYLAAVVKVINWDFVSDRHRELTR
ncbi:MAG: superoxide dismutase [Bryobacterales bacterium]|nr:superoxide dismutase [Bryobacterales bacterium]